MSSTVLKAFSDDQSTTLARMRKDMKTSAQKHIRAPTIQAIVEADEANRALFEKSEDDAADDSDKKLADAMRLSAKAGKRLLEISAQIDASVRCLVDMVKNEGKAFEQGSEGKTADEIVAESMLPVATMTTAEMAHIVQSRVVDMLDQSATRAQQILDQGAKMRDGGDEDDDEDDDDDELVGQAAAGSSASMECCITKAKLDDPVFK